MKNATGGCYWLFQRNFFVIHVSRTSKILPYIIKPSDIVWTSLEQIQPCLVWPDQTYSKMVLFLRCLSACKTKSYDSTRVKEFCFEKDNRISTELSFFFKSKILR